MGILRPSRLIAVWIVSVLMGSLPLAAQTIDPAATPDWPHRGDGTLPVDPQVHWGRLENGVRWAVTPGVNPPGRISLRLGVAAGSLHETEEERGLAHFLEHMSFKGSEGQPPGTLIAYLQRLGMAFGPDTNARTSFDSTVYQLELPGSSADLLEQGVRSLAETAFHLTIPADQLEPERGVVASERRLRDTPRQRSSEASLAFLLQGSRLPTRWPIGDEQVVATAPRERLEAFWRHWYRPSRLVVVAAGEVDPKRFEELVRTYFGAAREPAAPAVVPDLGTLSAKTPAARLITEPSLPASVALQRVHPADPRLDGIEPLRDYLNRLLAETILSLRLNDATAKPDSPATGAGAGSQPLQPVARISGIYLATTAERWADALALGEQTLRRALDTGFSDAEVATAVATLRQGFASYAAGGNTRENADLADEIVEAFTDRSVVVAPADLLKAAEPILDAATPAIVQAALRAEWGDGSPLIVVSGPIELKDPEAEILAAWERSRAVPVTAEVERATTVFAYPPAEAPVAPVSAEPVPDLQIESWVFPNNVRLDFRPAKDRADTVEIGVRIEGGRGALPKDRPALAFLAEKAFADGGLGRHEAEGFPVLFAGKRIGIDLVVSEASIVLRATTRPADLALQLAFLRAFVVDPGWRPIAVERLRRQLPSYFAGRAADPEGVMGGPVMRLVNGGDARYAEPTLDEAMAVDFDDLRGWLGPILAKAPLQVAITGDVAEGAVLDAVGRTFATLPEREPARLATLQAPIPPAPTSPQRFEHSGPATSARVAVFWRTTDDRDQRLAAGLDLLGEILSDRLLQAARERDGATYSPSAGTYGSLSRTDFGWLAATMDVAPADAQHMQDLVLDVAAGLAKGGITADELERARRPRLAGINASLASGQFWLYRVLIGRHAFPQIDERPARLKADLESYDPAQLDALAAKWLQPSKAMPVRIVPKGMS